MSIKKINLIILLLIGFFCCWNVIKKDYFNNYNLISNPETERIYFLKNNTEQEIFLNSRKIPVLLYHHISEDIINDMVVSPSNFESHMKVIHDNGYYTLSIDDIINYIEYGKEIPKKSVLITFDDGYYSNYEYAFPILKKYGMKATIFVIGAFFGLDTYKNTNFKVLPYFGFEEKNEMEKSGLIEIECHSYDLHQESLYEVELKTPNIYENILKTDTETQSEYEERLINDSNEWANLFNKEIKAYAYPHGESSFLSLSILRKINVKVTFNTIPRTDIIIKNNPISGYNIGRYTITEDFSADDIIKLIK